MSRSATLVWNMRVRKRLARATGGSGVSASALEGAIGAVADKMLVDPAVLLGSLATKPMPAALWNEILRALGPAPIRRAEDWKTATAVADTVAAAFRPELLLCWVVEPSQTTDVFILASSLAARIRGTSLRVIAAHSDPRVVEIGRSGLVPRASVANAPEETRSYFRQLDSCSQATPELHAVVHFECAPAGELPRAREVANGFHLIVCRGQLARAGFPEAQRLALRLRQGLLDGGFLFVGAGDHDDRLFGDLEPVVAPGVLLYRRIDAAGFRCASAENDFADLAAAVEADPRAWEPRWQLACRLLREGYAESAAPHLRELARRRPDLPEVWQMLADAYTLAGDTVSARIAQSKASLAAASAGPAKLLM